METPSDDVKTAPLKWRIPALGCVGMILWPIFCGLLLMCTPLGFIVVIPASHIWASVGTRLDFYRHEARYTRIIELIERDGIKPNESAYYRIPENWDKNSLTRLDLGQSLKAADSEDEDRVQPGQWAWACRNGEGILVARLGTYDLGHWGGYGLLYASRDISESQAQDWVTNCASVSRLRRGWWAYSRGD